MTKSYSLNRNILRLFKISLAVSLVFILITSGYALAAKKKAHGNLRQGVFVVATNNLDGRALNKTVIYVTQHDKSGTSGFIINRPTNLTVNEAFPKTHASSSTDNTLFFGGPLHSQYLFILTKTDFSQGLYPINRQIYFGTGKEMESRLQSDNKDTLRTYAGFMSWGPGQLDSELTAGDWILAPGNIDFLFSEDTSELWKSLFRRWAGSWT